MFSKSELDSALANAMDPRSVGDDTSRRKCRKPKQVLKPSDFVHGGDVGDEDDEGEATEEIEREIFECNFCPMKFPIRTAYLKHMNKVHKIPNPLAQDELLEMGDVKEEPFDELLDDMDGGVAHDTLEIPDAGVAGETSDMGDVVATTVGEALELGDGGVEAAGGEALELGDGVVEAAGESLELGDGVPTAGESSELGDGVTGELDNLFPDVTIKVEEVDATYLEV